MRTRAGKDYLGNISKESECRDCLLASDDNSYVFSECTIDYWGNVSMHNWINSYINYIL